MRIQHFHWNNEKTDLDLVTRPVLIIGPLADAIYDKLESEFNHMYARCSPKYTNWSQEDLDREMVENQVIDVRRRGSHYECTTVEAIRDVCERNQHCILNIHLESVERLHQHQVRSPKITFKLQFENKQSLIHSRFIPLFCLSSSSR